MCVRACVRVCVCGGLSVCTVCAGIFLHILADTLGSVGVIISSFLIDQFGEQVSVTSFSQFIVYVSITQDG